MLIAHLGDKVHHPENTLAAFEAAHGLGACAIATEVQFSREGTPWCFAGDNLGHPERGIEQPLSQTPNRDLKTLPLCSFGQLTDWASRHRHLEWFVELRATTLRQIGTERAIKSLQKEILANQDNFVLIASDIRSLRLARSLGFDHVALRVPDVARCLSAEVVTLAPDYLFIEHSTVDCQELPPGPWQWVVHEINTAQGAVHWRHRGAHHLLTGDLPLLMRSREASNVYGI
ncbi:MULTISPECIES: glycerophosphodiester phosphodiesterase family protein [Microbulbifer]|uniref:Glycerophosphodiester phosphodiesterase family protein n=1 Tax=Microbulbifer celer TaxID=435905 RepID=A0ABW3U6U3_9GAMM|nr:MULTISPECIES: glycerophosphodiester phosphodiesterase family protein [Microbulbifer]UFN57802.1 glycerophosphodiester phosphodiesterase [Microbulbifer celer]